MVVLEDHLLARGMTISRLEDEAAVYVVYSLAVLFDPVGVDLDLYLFVDYLLEFLLYLVRVFSLFAVLPFIK